MTTRIPETFHAFRIHYDGKNYHSGLENIHLSDLSPGEVIVKVAYSSVNYKDALAGTGKGKILRQYPLVGGIDVAGHVIASEDPNFQEGDTVLVTGCGLSETRDGGYSEYVRLESRWVIPVPAWVSLREVMGLGTAGFTAGLALYRMQANGQTPEMGPVVITGATGGVGMLAVDIFTRAGFTVHVITGKTQHFDFLEKIGAKQCFSRQQMHWGQRPLESTEWAGALDNVGGEILAGLTRVIQPYGNIASCGMAGGIELNTTVMPFIIRGVSLLGIASAGTSLPIRQHIWEQLWSDWWPHHLDKIITHEAKFNDLPSVFAKMLDGKSFGRTIVAIQ